MASGISCFLVITILVALTAATVAGGGQAGSDVAGKWTGDEFPDSFVVRQNPINLSTGPGDTPIPCLLQNPPVPVPGRADPGTCIAPPLIKPSKPVELDLKVDTRSGKVSGSISLPERAGVRRGSCGKLTVEDARVHDGVLEFTTYRTINGIRIPTRWSADVTQKDRLTLRTDDPSPCAGPPQAIPTEPLLALGRGMLPINLLDFSAPAATLTYKRANPPGKPGNVAGKWWTTERNHLFALDLKVDGKNKVSGSINVCGIVPREIASGEVVDRRVTFQVPWPTGTPGGPAPGGVPRGRGVRNLTVWSGDLVAPDTLTLASPPGFACINDRPRTIVLARSR